MSITARQALALAHDLASESGENPEYDAGLLEFIGHLAPEFVGDPVTREPSEIISAAMRVARDSRSHEYTRAVAELMSGLVGGETAVVYTMLTNLGTNLPDESKMTPHEYLVMLARTRREVQAPIREGKTINAIKALRSISSAGLKEAKEAVVEVMG